MSICIKYINLVEESPVEDFQRFDNRRLERQARWLRELRAWRNALVQPVPDWTFTGADGVARRLTIVDTPVTLTATARIPDEWAGHPVELELWLGGEAYVRHLVYGQRYFERHFGMRTSSRTCRPRACRRSPANSTWSFTEAR